MDKKSKSLSKNQKIVLDFIQKNKKPVKAYSILSNVQKKGINAPPQVYRALDKFCLLYTSPSPRDGQISRMPSSA